MKPRLNNIVAWVYDCVGLLVHFYFSDCGVPVKLTAKLNTFNGMIRKQYDR